jgi:UMF1 family MFS transporter
MYDFANSAFTTLIVTFIYGVFFTQSIAPDANYGTTLWARAISGIAIVVAVLSPFMGAIADRSGYRRRFLATTTALAIIGAALLYVPKPGQVMLALTIFIVADIVYEISGVFYNSYLPDIAPPDRIGRISGYGYALGYMGGLLAMVVALFAFILPEQPWFGVSKVEGEHVRATTVLVAVWFAVFSIPFFAWVKEMRQPSADSVAEIARDAARRLASTFREIRRYRQIFRLLIARMIYNDGLITIFAFGGIYAAETFGFSLREVMYFGLALNVTGGLGAFLMGFLDDRIGGKRTIMITIAGLIVGCLGAVLVTTKPGLWIAGLFIGLFVGPNQAASRSLLGRFVPHEKETEFYGFFAFSGKAIAFLGPFMLGEFTRIFQSQRAGVAALLIFFVVGAALLTRVNEAEGFELARRPVTPV